MDFEPGRTEDKQKQLANIFSELCVRLQEMEEIKPASSVKLISRLFRLNLDSVDAYRVLLCSVTNMDSLLVSYEDQAAKAGVSKQAAHKAMQAQLKVLDLHFPEIVSHVRSLRDAAHHGHGNRNQGGGQK